MSRFGSRSFAGVGSLVALITVLGGIASATAASAAGELPYGAYVIQEEEGGFSDADCVSATLCYATDATSTVSRFNPLRLDQSTRVERDGLRFPTNIVCPALDVCVIRSAFGRQTFDPTTTSTSPQFELGIRPYGVSPSCPTTTQCTAIDNSNGIVTFDPTSSATPDPSTTPEAVGTISCPSASLCVAAGASILVFDPAAPAAAVRTTAPGNGLYEIECPTTTQCTGLGKDFQLTFDPRSPGAGQPVKITKFDDSLRNLECPSVNQCVATESPRPSSPGAPYTVFALGFDPAKTTKPVRTELYLSGSLSCVSARQCTSVGSDGSMERSYAAAQTFDPMGRSQDAVTYRKVTFTPKTEVVIIGSAKKSAVGRTVTTTLSRRFKDDVVIRSDVQRPGRFRAAFGKLKAGTYETRSVLNGNTIKRTTITIPAR